MTDQEIRARVHRAVDTTLSGLQGDPLLSQRVILRARQKEEPQMKKKLSVGLVLVLALVLMSVTGLAAAGLWGVIDFTGLYGTKLLDSAADTVQTGIPQQGGKGEYTSFTLREAICDGQAAYMVFDVTPADAHTLLIAWDFTLEDSAANFENGAPEEMTIAEYAAANGYTRVLQVSVSERYDEDGEAGFIISSGEDRLTENGITLSVIAEGTLSGTTEMIFDLWVIDAESGERLELVPLTATLQADAPLWSASSHTPVDYPEAGIRIDSVEMTGTVMGIYTSINFTVTDQAIYDSFDQGFWLELLDENGERMDSGAITYASISEPDESGQAHYIGNVQAMTEAPTSIGIRAYSAWTKERCHPVTVELGE